VANPPEFKGLVLAAGRGTRFAGEPGRSMPKVLRPVLGRPIISYVLSAVTEAGVADVALVVGYQALEVEAALGDGFVYVLQKQQKGSGHAVACAREEFSGFDGHLVVMCGDSPLFRAETIRKMMRAQVDTGAVVTLASAVLENPFGYGRILRNGQGRITGIVEEKCASPAQRAIREVNGGAYVFDAPWLFGSIDDMAVNEAGEYNLTDMVRVAVGQGRRVSAVECRPEELQGVNTPEQLLAIEEVLRDRQCG
jgi:bifunctional UDP-N-acetylglucosamine pyrophosphorylase/glucosamine-1-phosphate N-acetyltransferase